MRVISLKVPLLKLLLTAQKTLFCFNAMQSPAEQLLCSSQLLELHTEEKKKLGLIIGDQKEFVALANQ